MFSFAVLGFSSLVSQAVVIRELGMSFYGNEFFIGWVLFAWMLWTAVGSFLEKIFSRAAERIFAWMGFCHVLAALFFPLALLLIRACKLLMRTPAGAVPELVPSLVFSFAALAPFCLVLGFQFALVARGWALQEPGVGNSRVVGSAYFYETIGFIAGGLFFSYVLVFLGEFLVTGILASINLLAACVFLIFSFSGNRLLRRVIVACAVFFLFCFFMNGAWIQDQSARWRFPNETLVVSKNTIHGNLAVTRAGEQYNFYQNSSFLGTGEEKLSSEYLVHFPILTHPQPRKVLLIGTGFNGPLREILKYGPDEVVDVELDPRQIEMARAYLARDLRDVLEASRVKIWLGDSRKFLRTNRDKFDVVIVNAPDPSTVLMNRQYTADFFKKIDACLAPGGIVAARLGFAANTVTPELENLAASIYKTLKHLFPNVLALPEDTMYVMASKAPLTKDPGILIRRMAQRGIKNDFVTADYIRYRLTNDRVERVKELLEKNRTASLNKDLRPRGYYYDFLYWVSSFNPGLAKTLAWPMKLPFGYLCGIMVILIFLWRLFFRSGQALAAMAMVTGGFSLMAAEILWIYCFQVFYGNVYYRIAWIITAFMAGMGAGTWFANRRIFKEPRPVLGWLHFAMTDYFFVLTLLAWLLARGSFGIAGGWTEVVFLAAAAGLGALVGIEFPLANQLFLTVGGTQEVKPGTIYAADLFGACLGALLTAAFLIPVWGVNRTLLLLGCLNGAVSLLLFFRKDLGGKDV